MARTILYGRCSCGAPTLEETEELQNQLIAIMQKSGMSLYKWSSKHKNISLTPGEGYNFENEIETKTLGVSLNVKEDCFNF